MHIYHSPSFIPSSKNLKAYNTHIGQGMTCKGDKLKLEMKLRCPFWHYL